MTRCLFWNVEHFGEKRFYNASSDTDTDAGMTWALSSTARKDLLYRVIEAANPDIIVIVETVAQSTKGSRMAQRITAPVELLNWLRTTAPTVRSAGWRLVPPLVLAGQPGNVGQEAIAVFYRGTTGTTERYFTGPNIWPGGVDGPSLLPGTRPAAAYGTNKRLGQNVDLNAFLVPPTTTARTIPAGALHNGNGTTAENTVGARIQLRVLTSGAAGANLDFGVARPPFMVSFTEQASGGALRNLTLFGVHAPANAPGAARYITDLSTAFEVSGALGTHETRIIGGDFNANLLQDDGTLTTTFDPLTKDNSYRQLLRPTAGAPSTPGALEAWKGYFGTHINPLDDPPLVSNRQTSRFLWSNGSTASYYPPYRYQSAAYYSIDNVLIWPLDGSRDYQTTIMNTVVSSPLSAVTPVPAGASAGSVAVAAEIEPIIPFVWPQAPDAADYDAGNATMLLAWERYGHIVSTSDHFALFTDV
ncbi:hypothetical protein KK141_09825 [Dyella sp. LX-66]|uniref:endonuclease/exonuclease/phosphatase family protein n=1 Tax=unclassified Dyella TaxID=2634549 RepID=UPI001BE119CB|nr:MULTISPECIES: endonuclease/exonuclease/phosphatase family protein [unclassified Dyella]MBT2117095.1 hypothetical protein [Dyella sp. LX-1]MBT2139829.1 hypothetical protein [Dyella sp. LX-66]